MPDTRRHPVSHTTRGLGVVEHQEPPIPDPQLPENLSSDGVDARPGLETSQ